ncbi:hypothetical protein APED_26700 [Acanthopleuribacter pedis]
MKRVIFTLIILMVGVTVMSDCTQCENGYEFWLPEWEFCGFPIGPCK